MTHRNRSRANQNLIRRLKRADECAPLPMESTPTVKGQLQRAAENTKAHAERYPRPPVYDPFAHVRGDPNLRGKRPDNQKPVNPLRQLTLMHLMAAFNVDQVKRRKRKPEGDK